MGILLIAVLAVMKPQVALAFGCNGEWSTTKTINVDLSKNELAQDIRLWNFLFYCNGDPNNYDALRIEPNKSYIHPKLAGLGYTGYVNISGNNYYLNTVGYACVWPNTSCGTAGANIYSPLRGLGIKRTSVGNWNDVTIPAGTELIRVAVQQRGNYGTGPGVWGGNYNYWILKTANEISFPAYSCTVTNPEQTIILPTVGTTNLRNNGAGKYPTAVPFNLNLNCESQAVVSINFEGENMAGTDNVLANTTSGNDSVGVQMVYNNTPIKLGQNLRVINNAQSQEVLPLNAYYYYNGGEVSGGGVTAVSTFTLSYN